ncbi:MFS general substrate transporter [Colletotrichum somersetense]|nr:MFS general substrate transporter [Colletotrichum somersetense]
MSTVLAKDPLGKGDYGETLISLDSAPPLGAPIEEKRFWFQRNKSYDPSAIATQPSVFDDPDSAQKYHPRSDWENYHRCDSLARWTWREEYALVRKIDFRIIIWASIIFMALELDSANINQANTDNMLNNHTDFNLGNTVFKLAFLCAELPSQLVSNCQFWLNGRDSFLACRALLGLLQGGFITKVILYLSYFYKHHELSLRLGFFWTAMSTADTLSAIFAYEILHMRGLEGQTGWRWLFLVEGLLTLVIGIFGVLREDPSKSSMHNRESITRRLLWDSLKDYDLWPLYALGLTFQIPMTPPSQYLALTLRNLGFDTFQANLLAIPYTVGHMITMLAITYLGEVVGELTFVSMSGQVNRWVLYALITLLLMYPNGQFLKPTLVGWNSRNSNTVRSRTVSAACYNMFVQTGGIISSNIYRSDDAPLYKRGNRSLLGIVCMNLLLYPLVKSYYVYRNKKRDVTWNGMSEAQRIAYLEKTKDEDN